MENASFSTAIYFLLQRGDFSAFHRIKSDECWHFYEGKTIIIHVINEAGEYAVIYLGRSIEKGEVYQAVVPAGAWFASEPGPGTDYALVGCTVAPGFDFRDFEMADKKSHDSYVSSTGAVAKQIVPLMHQLFCKLPEP